MLSAGWRAINQSSCCSVHQLTSGPLIQVKAMVILCIDEARAGMSWLTRRYVENSLMKLLAFE